MHPIVTFLATFMGLILIALISAPLGQCVAAIGIAVGVTCLACLLAFFWHEGRKKLEPTPDAARASSTPQQEQHHDV